MQTSTYALIALTVALFSFASYSASFEEAIEKEKAERLERQAELYEKVSEEIKRENQWIEVFQRDTIAEFEKDRADIEKEMDNRFGH